MNYLSRPSHKSTENADFRDTYYKVNLNLSKLKAEIQKKERLSSRLSNRGSMSSPRKPFDETLRTEANTYTAAKRSPRESLNDTPLNLRRSLYSRTSTSPKRNFNLNSSPYVMKHDVADAIERKHKLERALKEAEINRTLNKSLHNTYISSSPYRPTSPRIDKYPDIKDDIRDVKLKLDRISGRLHQRAEDINDEIDYIETTSQGSRRRSRELYVPGTSFLTRPVESPSRQLARRRSIEVKNRALKSFRESSVEREKSYIASPGRKYFEADYNNIGGNPEYFPDAYENEVQRGYPYSTSMDYQCEKRTSSPRRTYTETTIVRRSSCSRSHSPRDHGYKNSYSDVDTVLESCKIKRDILRHKLDHAEDRLREVARQQAFEEELNRSRARDRVLDTDYVQRDYDIPRNSHRERESSADEFRRLKNIKETRTIHNHDLNLLKRNYDQLRAGEPSFNASRSYIFTDADTTGLPAYRSLLNENSILKSKMSTAQRVLDHPF